MKYTLMAFILVAAPLRGAEALTEAEVEEVRTLHRERLADYAFSMTEMVNKHGAREDNMPLTWAELDAMVKDAVGPAATWNSLDDRAKRATFLRKIESEPDFKDRIEKHYKAWRERQKRIK